MTRSNYRSHWTKLLLFGVCSMGIFALSMMLMWAQQESDEVNPGRVIEKVLCYDKPECSYACYLPKKYTSEVEWPILYCFSPNANGLAFVQRYHKVCEKVGWIVVGSNDSKNGPMQLEAIASMWQDTQNRFAINSKNIYVSGFSGGARVATWFASKHKAQGHIAIGGVYSGNAPLPDMAYWLTCGEDGFNRPEMEKAEQELKKAKRQVKLEIFIGGHQMPPQDVIEKAVKWLESLRAQSPKELEEELKKLIEQVKQVMETDPVNAYFQAARCEKEYKQIKGIKEIKKLIKELKKNKEVQYEIKASNALERSRKYEKRLKLPKQKSYAIKSYQKVIKRYPDTRASAEAQQRIKELKEMEE